MESHVSATVTMPAGHGPTGRLALALQEAFTAVVRLREGRQIPSDSAAFRARMKDLLASADQEARRMGYPPEFVKVAVYCVIAYLDETVMNTHGPLASAWVGQPLQEEVFGDHVAGETNSMAMTALFDFASAIRSSRMTITVVITMLVTMAMP